jgi:hypothetical protein
MVISDDQFRDLCDDRISANDLIPITEIGLHEFDVKETDE